MVSSIMRAKKSVSKNSVSWSIIDNVRDINGKSTTKIIERLGNEAEIKAKHPGVDPEQWVREYAKYLTEQKKKAEIPPIIAKYNPLKQIPANKRQSVDVGYLFLQSIYYQLKLDDVVAEISARHQFQFDLNEILSRLIYMRILHPSSKKNSFEQAKSLLEGVHCEPHQFYRALDILKKESSFIQQKVYETSSKIVPRSKKILYYDCTNFYFEIEQDDNFRRYGISKEHRPNPIVQMGLFMDASGLPLAFSIFKGNENEQGSLKPLEKQIISDFELSQVVVCTDAGLSSKNNRLYNTLGQRGFITTQSIKKLKKHLKDWVLDSTGWSTNEKGRKIDISKLEEDVDNNQIYYKERWIHENGLEQRLLITFSPKYKQYQQAIRQRQVDRAIAKVDYPSSLKRAKSNDPARFIKRQDVTSDGEVATSSLFSIDEKAIADEAKYDGFYGVCTNLESDPKEIIRINHQRWEIEESFRIMKTELRSRPVYVRTEDRIEAHFLTCFLSLLIYRILEQKLNEKFTCPQIIHTLRDMKMAELSGEGYIPMYERTDLTDALHETFRFRTDFEIVPTNQMKKILKQTKKDK